MISIWAQCHLIRKEPQDSTSQQLELKNTFSDITGNIIKHIQKKHIFYKPIMNILRKQPGNLSYS